MSNALLSTAISVRQMVIQLVESIPEDLFDVQPNQFNNTIRWNVGHITFTHEYFLSLGLPINSGLPDNYAQLFNTGTKPSDWSPIPPTKEELIQNLSRQLSNVTDIPSNTFDQQMDPPIELGPLKFETFGEVFNFATVHETMHFTTISCLLKVLQYQKV
ncbi:DinB family protein [Pseudalkalibacillus salsuginis]|uniref:DinB family protein n=1 Tax=Pseudalkalibacillus salsuginis TaxID=2910972 RepID=UPI001F25ED63|nr:DinB family protein [Pseudalkalibacillus salsuginis]MCF6409730.1 DinB family protein [Pseudalkalibacillus salsuginis]